METLDHSVEWAAGSSLLALRGGVHEFVLDIGTFEKLPVPNSLETSPFLHRGPTENNSLIRMSQGIVVLAVR